MLQRLQAKKTYGFERNARLLEPVLPTKTHARISHLLRFRPQLLTNPKTV